MPPSQFGMTGRHLFFVSTPRDEKNHRPSAHLLYRLPGACTGAGGAVSGAGEGGGPTRSPSSRRGLFTGRSSGFPSSLGGLELGDPAPEGPELLEHELGGPELEGHELGPFGSTAASRAAALAEAFSASAR